MPWVQVQDFAGAARGIATTTLRAVIGDISLDDVLARREQINNAVRAELDEDKERWGVTGQPGDEVHLPAGVHAIARPARRYGRSRVWRQGGGPHPIAAGGSPCQFSPRGGGGP